MRVRSRRGTELLELLEVEAVATEPPAPARPPRGRPLKVPTSADGVLVAAVLARTGDTQAELAARLGLADGAVLSRANTVPLPDHRREELVAMLRTPEGRPVLAPREREILHALHLGEPLPEDPASWRALERQGLVGPDHGLLLAGRHWLKLHPSHLRKHPDVEVIHGAGVDHVRRVAADLWTEVAGTEGIDTSKVGLHVDLSSAVLSSVFAYWIPGSVPEGKAWATGAVDRALSHVRAGLEVRGYVFDGKVLIGYKPPRELDAHEAEVMWAARLRQPRGLAYLRRQPWYEAVRTMLVDLGYVTAYGRGRSAGLRVTAAGEAWLVAHPRCA